jgi:hypothetical protein
MEAVNRNGNQLMKRGEENPLQKTETQLTATQQGKLSEIFGKSITPLGEIVAQITGALGRSEAEFKITEKSTYKET